MRTARSSTVPGDRDLPLTENPPRQRPLLDRDPPVDRQTLVKILPCPKIRLREVIKLEFSSLDFVPRFFKSLFGGSFPIETNPIQLRVNFIDFATPDVIWLSLMVHMVNSGGSRIFPRGVRQLPKLLLFFKFLPKTAWEWKNLDPRGGGSARPWRPPPLDPPMIPHIFGRNSERQELN